MKSIVLLTIISLVGCTGSDAPVTDVFEPGLPPAEDTYIPDCQKLTGKQDYRKNGPFGVKQDYADNVRFYVPTSDDKHCMFPLVHFSNGTGARCSMYQSLLGHLASWGFLVTCHESPNTGNGLDCLKGASVATKRYGDIYLSRIGSVGHSQGGGGAIACAIEGEASKAWDGFTFAAAAIEPAHGYNYPDWREEYPTLKSPVYMFSGSRDQLVTKEWVQVGYDLLRSEKYFYEAVGASHITVLPWAESSVTPFLRWKLLGDKSARRYFLNRPLTAYWRTVSVKP